MDFRFDSKKLPLAKIWNWGSIDESFSETRAPALKKVDIILTIKLGTPQPPDPRLLLPQCASRGVLQTSVVEALYYA
ncbi:hypothetical protein HGRIS_003568 [Hohenbuehelia grisea]|uniref:Uncharacterized protein n=1 Tax=Hohenbuehelia grisea TaxID=104357 RepID=A0ABR3JGX4_9AGAR